MVNDEDVDEFLKQVIDRFTAYELVELLGLSTEDIVDAFHYDLLGLGREILE